MVTPFRLCAIVCFAVGCIQPTTPTRDAGDPADGPRSSDAATDEGGTCVPRGPAYLGDDGSCVIHADGRLINCAGLARGAADGLRFRAVLSRATCAIDVDGQVHCWGLNHHGQLGTGTNDDEVHTDLTRALTPPGFRAVEIAGSQNLRCVRGAGGGVMCWGDHHYGAVGVGPYGDECVQTGTVDPATGETGRTRCVRRPVRVELPGPAVDISVGSIRACAALADGRVFCWGQRGPFHHEYEEGGRACYHGRCDDVPTEVLGLAGQGVTGISTDRYALTSSGLVRFSGLGEPPWTLVEPVEGPTPTGRFLNAPDLCVRSDSGRLWCIDDDTYRLDEVEANDLHHLTRRGMVYVGLSADGVYRWGINESFDAGRLTEIEPVVDCSTPMSDSGSAQDAGTTEGDMFTSGRCTAGCDLSGDAPRWYLLSGASVPSDLPPGTAEGFDLDGRVSDEDDTGGCGRADGTSPTEGPGIDSEFPVVNSAIEAAGGLDLDGRVASETRAGRYLLLLELAGASGCHDPEVTLRFWAGAAPAELSLEADGSPSEGQQLALAHPTPLGELRGELAAGELRVAGELIVLDPGTPTLLSIPLHAPQWASCVREADLSEAVLGGAHDLDALVAALIQLAPDLAASPDLVRDLVGGFADMTVDPAEPCEAISTSWRLEAVAVTLD